MSERVARALARASEAVTEGLQAPTPDAPRRVLAIGDPQTSSQKFFEVLDRHGLLSDEGWLAPTVRLTSLGDHFDHGPFEERHAAGKSGLQILGWLAAHAVEQVTLLAGNHDLSRVAELQHLDDAAFQRAAEEANALYQARPRQPELERAFLLRYPMFPTVEVAARDLSTFSVAQREWVTRLLVAGRFRLAASEQGVLLVHAGATTTELDAAGVDQRDQSNADRVAAALNRVFDEAVAAWDRTMSFEVPGLFAKGSAAVGEPGGFLYHRPAHPSLVADAGEVARRFDPRTLPLGLVQAVGHVRDAKCRTLLKDWVTDDAAEEGELRHLVTDGNAVRYARGRGSLKPASSSEARMLFLDGGMHHAKAERYELLEWTVAS